MVKAVDMFHKHSIRPSIINKVPLYRLNQSSTKSNVNNRLMASCRTYTMNLVSNPTHVSNNNPSRDVKCLISRLSNCQILDSNPSNNKCYECSQAS